MSSHLYIVTGSSRGLGQALASQLLAPQHQVLGIARQHSQALTDQARAAGAPLTQWPMDLGDPLAAALALAEWLQSPERGAIASATLINNAGLVGQPAHLAKAPLLALSAAIRVGLEATLLLTASFLSATADPARFAGPRRVMNISSGLGRRAMGGAAAYCAAKAGMDHFSRAAALEQAGAPNAVLIESIAPGVIDTDMQAELRGADAAMFPERVQFEAMQSQGQLVSPAACAAQLLRHLHGPRFGQEVITDIRNAG